MSHKMLCGFRIYLLQSVIFLGIAVFGATLVGCSSTRSSEPNSADLSADATRLAESKAREYGVRQELHEGWHFADDKDKTWRGAKVPGAVHTDLLDQGIIADPFYRNNERQVQWVGERNWTYRTTFDVDPKVFSRDNVNLVFKGLDTYADVYLNGALILKADNMHREWVVPCRSVLRAKSNELNVLFKSISEVDMPKWQAAPFRLLAWPNNDQADVQLSLYARKAGFHFGWDWGPRLVTYGIWRPVYLEGWDELKLKDLQFHQSNVSEKQADIRTVFEVEATRSQKIRLDVTDAGHTYGTKEFQANPGLNRVELNFKIQNPRLWWTNGLGPQNLYTFTGIVRQGGRILGMRQITTGIRSLKIVREPDVYGKSLYVQLNGVPVFMKGANYIPQDNFQQRVTPARYEYMIKSAAEANMNMLRVWGGGIYEEDIFYELCDRYGILLWQDLMFACGMFPGDPAFVDSVKHELVDNVKRLRNHPSIALFNGNNENEISWYAWGWKDKYPPDVQAKYEQDLHNLFHDIIPTAIREIDPDVYYHPTSPTAGFADRPYGDGDVHYWSVWHGQAPFGDYNTNIGRFMSEYGFQSFPEMSTVKKFTEPEDRFLDSEVMLEHQRCRADDRRDRTYGNRLIATYMDREYKHPKDFESYLYVSQLLQAEGVKIAIEAHRRNRPQCMGTLYWQIDDCWPVASWSSIDYYGRWKALHYYVKKAYANLLITPYAENGILGIHIVSDLLQPQDATLNIKVIDFDGKVLSELAESLRLEPNVSKKYTQLDLKATVGSASEKRTFLLLTLSNANHELARNVYYLTPSKELELQRPEISFNVRDLGAQCLLELDSPTLARNVFLEPMDDSDAKFSDNYFDLLPKEKVTVTVTNLKKNGCSKANWRVRSLVDTFEAPSTSAPPAAPAARVPGSK